MKTRIVLYHLLYPIIMAGTSCKQYYNPPAITANKNYLVVSGFIDAGEDSSIFTLTRTSNLNSTSPLTTELGAVLTIEGSSGYASQLTELGNGRYGSSGLHLDPTQNYRLRIGTTNGEKYLSNYEPVKSSPPIDSISWQRSDSGVTAYANTHDLSNNTRYYRWDYVETWEYHSLFDSYWHYDTASRAIINNNIEVPHICYRTVNSNNIVIASSAKLTRDIISFAPLIVIPLNSNKLSVRYSLLVRQYALTADEYNYWQALQASTEQTGTLFDQEPSQITGNISCLSNPNEPVIGYVGAGAVAESRIFITNQQVFPWYFNQGCVEMVYGSEPDSIQDAVSQGLLPVDAHYTANTLTGYVYSQNVCVDCTLQGGNTIKPSFW